MKKVSTKIKKTYTQMIQVNRKTQHYRIYTLIILYTHNTHTRKNKKEKDNREMKRKYFK